jgi:hypothetical protein
MATVFQVLSAVAVIALAAVVNAYPGYAHQGLYPISAPFHVHEYHVSILKLYGNPDFISSVARIDIVFLYVLKIDTCLET